jgi:3-hydroxybutyryl-CoA dehydratase
MGDGLLSFLKDARLCPQPTGEAKILRRVGSLDLSAGSTHSTGPPREFIQTPEDAMDKTPFKTCYFEDLAIGMRETFMKTVKNEDVIGFAELSGDHNPIHLSEHFARKTRFGGRIVHGLYTASLISAVIGMRLPGPGSVYISQSLNFRGPVKIGDVIAVSVEVAELTEKGRRVRLHCECAVEGKVVLDGEGVLSVPARKSA